MSLNKYLQVSVFLVVALVLANSQSTYSLTAINRVVTDQPYPVIIDPRTSRLTFRYCSYFTLSYTLSGSSLKIASPAFLGDTNCKKYPSESQLLASLEEVAQYVFVENRLSLQNANGVEVIRLVSQGLANSANTFIAGTPTTTPVAPVLPIVPLPTPIPVPPQPQPSTIVGEWSLQQVNESRAPFQKDVKINFSADNRVSGKVCNNFFGSYSVGVSNSIKIGPLASTLMFCFNDFSPSENEVTGALSSAASYWINGNQLAFYDVTGRVVLIANRV